MKVLIFVLVISIIPLHSTEFLIMVSGNSPTETFQGRLLNLIYTDAFNRLGLSWEYQVFPGKRRDHLLDTGKVDGELSRVFSYGDDHPELIRINESPFSISMSIFSKKNIKINSLDKLKDGKYKIGVLRGSKQPNQIVDDFINKGYINKRDRYEFNNYQSGIKMLMNNRIDLILGNSFGIIDQIQSSRTINIQKVLEISSYPIYSYFHKKNAHIIPLMESVIKDIKSEGLVELYKIQAQDIK